MQYSKVNTKQKKSNNYLEGLDDYDNWMSIDYSQETMAIARMRKKDKEPTVVEFQTNLGYLKDYLSKVPGRTILTIEETTSTHLLYVALLEKVERIVICDPYMNKLVINGPSTDKIDAKNLCKLLRMGGLTEVYHSNDVIYDLRKLVSGYEDIIKWGVRSKNQRSALYRIEGKKQKKKTKENELSEENIRFVSKGLEEEIALYHQLKKEYEGRFAELCRKNKLLRYLKEIPGIGIIGSIKILATVVDAKRFSNSKKFLSYCGLVLHQQWSGGRYYGQKPTRYSRRLKSVYKTAAITAINGNNPISEYYEKLIKSGVYEHNARNKIARYICSISYGIIKTGKKYSPYKWRGNKKEKEITKIN